MTCFGVDVFVPSYFLSVFACQLVRAYLVRLVEGKLYSSCPELFVNTTLIMHCLKCLQYLLLFDTCCHPHWRRHLSFQVYLLVFILFVVPSLLSFPNFSPHEVLFVPSASLSSSSLLQILLFLVPLLNFISFLSCFFWKGNHGQLKSLWYVIQPWVTSASAQSNQKTTMWEFSTYDNGCILFSVTHSLSISLPSSLFFLSPTHSCSLSSFFSAGVCLSVGLICPVSLFVDHHHCWYFYYCWCYC